MLISCPVCHERHRVNTHYDNQDYICSNTDQRQSQKIFRGVKPSNILSRSAYNYNAASTKIDEARAVTVLVHGPSYRDNGEKITTWLYRNNFPKGFQTLCFNCNWGKHINDGICPHQQK